MRVLVATLLATLVPALPAFAAPTVAPTNLHVTGQTNNSLSFAWDLPASDGTWTQEARNFSGPAPGGGDVGYGWVFGTNGMGTATYVNLVCGSSYTLQVAVADGSFESALGPIVSITTNTLPCVGPPPAAPTGLAATTSETDVVFDWDAPPAGVSGIAWTFDGQGRHAAQSDDAGTTFTQNSFDPVTVVCGEPYTMSIAWVDTEGLTSPATNATASADPCQPFGSGPDNLHLLSQSGNTFDFGWNAFVGPGLWYVRTSGSGGPPYTYRANTTTHARLDGLCSASYTFVAQWVFTDGTVSDPSALPVSTAACPAPNVSADVPASITDSSATLRGFVNPKLLHTTYHFEYGPTSDYGTSTPVGDAGEGTDQVSVSAPIAGLSSNTVYHYRLVATNSSGTSATTDRAFQTTGSSSFQPVNPPVLPPTPLPPPTQQCVVPRLKGMTVLKAKKALKAAHCGVGAILKKSAGAKLRRKVIRSVPGAGRRLPAGTKVKLIVGR